MDNERTADVLQVALASYDRKELRVQKNYLEEQNPVLACTCFLNGHKLLQELQQGHNFDIVVLCSQMEDMSSIEFMMELRKLEHKPLLMLFDEGRRKNSSALRMEDSGSCCCVERMELKNLLRELYRMPGQQWQRTEQQPAAVPQLGHPHPGHQLQLSDQCGGRGLRHLAEAGHPQGDPAGGQ